MSSKNTKINIEIPLYDIEGQLSFVSDVCNTFEFDTKKLIPLMFADWILHFQEQCQVVGPHKAFLGYLEHTKVTHSKLMELKKYCEKNRK